MSAGTLKGIADTRDTRESRELDRPHQAQPLLTNGQTNERLPSGADRTYLGPETRKRLGIRDEEAVRWVLDTSNTAWAQHVSEDRVADAMDGEAGARLVESNGKPVRLRDCVLMAFPKAHEEAYLARQQEDVKEYIREQELADHPDSYKPRNQQDMEEIRDRNTQTLTEAGIIGPNSPTHGKPLAVAMQMYSKEEIAAEAARYRSQGRSTPQHVSEARAEAAERASAATGGRKSFAIGASFDKQGKLVRAG